MPVVNVERNTEELRMVVTTEFAATVDQVWRLWSDATFFERWWGPPGITVTSQAHEVVTGGKIEFVFNAPDGDKYPQVWEVIEASAPTHLVLRDADVDENGAPADGNSLTKFEITVEAAGDKTRMLVTSHFDSIAGMEKALEMGIEEGMRMTVGKADVALAGVAAA